MRRYDAGGCERTGKGDIGNTDEKQGVFTGQSLTPRGGRGGSKQVVSLSFLVPFQFVFSSLCLSNQSGTPGGGAKRRLW